jgi:hypothetical protein
MVAGFLGTLISVERVLATSVFRATAYRGLRLPTWLLALAPIGTLIGSLLLFIGAPAGVGIALISFASGLITLHFLLALFVDRTWFTASLLLGAAAWLTGNLAWLAGRSLPSIWPLWSAYLILTIAGERLDLARLLILTPVKMSTFIAAASALLTGAVLHLLGMRSGLQLNGVGALGLALWLMRFDIARRTLQKTGLPRFSAIALLSGYFWLGMHGILLLAYPGQVAGPIYDAQLHSLFLGFVFSLIFGHAPIILPALLGAAPSHHWRDYLALLILHLSVGMRIWGDLSGMLSLRRWGGMLNAVALLIFLITTAVRMRAARSKDAGREG